MSRILLVEDNENLAFGLQRSLEVEGFQVTAVTEGEEALRRLSEFDPNLLVLDLMLPGMDGFDVLERLREEGQDVPVLVLSARGEEMDKLLGFRLGADDYVTKPFGVSEVVARIRAILRRAGEPNGVDAARRLERFGDVEVDPSARIVRKAGEEVPVTPKELDLLLALLRRDGAVAPRLELLEEVWGHRAAVVTRTVDTHVAELRRKLEDDSSDPAHIVTVSKAGYRLVR